MTVQNWGQNLTWKNHKSVLMKTWVNVLEKSTTYTSGKFISIVNKHLYFSIQVNVSLLTTNYEHVPIYSLTRYTSSWWRHSSTDWFLASRRYSDHLILYRFVGYDKYPINGWNIQITASPFVVYPNDEYDIYHNPLSAKTCVS